MLTLKHQCAPYLKSYDQPHIEGVNNVFSNKSVISELPEIGLNHLPKVWSHFTFYLIVFVKF